MTAKDPYRYFRVEARELLDGMSRGVIELEREARVETVVSLLRQAHTLKGAARVVGVATIAEQAHAIEDALAPHRDEIAGELPIDDLLARLDAVREGIAVLDAPPDADAPEAEEAAGATDARAAGARSATAADPRAADAPPQPAATRPEAPPRRPRQPPAEPASPPAAAALRVAAEDLDEVVSAAGELGSYLARLEGVGEELDRLGLDLARRGDGNGHGELAAALAERVGGLSRGFWAAVEAAGREVARVREHALAMRLVPASSIFPLIERVVRDAATAAGLRVNVAFSGGAVRIDRQVLSAVREALPHVARNAVTHGLRPRAGEQRAEAGVIRLEVERRAARVLFRLVDEGRGIDLEAVRRAAVASGHLGEEEAAGLDEAAIARLVFAPGVSTAGSLDQLSGRGVGLDAVRALVESVQGEVTVDSVPGRQTAFTLDVPLSLSSFPALVVEAGGRRWSIPLDQVQAVVALGEGERQGADRLVVDGRSLPFARTTAIAGGESDTPRLAVVVAAADGAAALAVTRIGEIFEAPVHPVPPLAGRLPLVAGFTVDLDNRPRVMLDVDGLVAAVARSRGTMAVPAPAAPRPLPVLVVDDSLTSRMLQQSILESAGYEVEVATSGEEAIERARQQPFGLFLVDIEMPGMNGFDFVRLARQDGELAEVPAVLVTSLAGREERRRGLEVGAAAYVVKGEFDQEAFLGLVSRLVRLS